MAASSSTIELTMRGRVVAWLAGLAASAAWLGEDANARVAAALLAAPLLIDFVLKQRRLHATGIRVGLRRTVARAPFTEQLIMTHNGRWPLRECLLVEPSTMRTEPPQLLPTLLPNVAQRVTFRARSNTRGHGIERVFLLTSTWPLGLFQARAIIALEAELITEPARVRLRADLMNAVAEREAAPRDRSALAGPEFHSLREHQADEDSRAVHALRSAALGLLVRRVTRGRMPRTVGLVLDLRRPPNRLLEGGKRRFEWSLGACATLLTELRARGAELDVIVLDAEPNRILVQSRAREIELLTLLAEATPTPFAPLPRQTLDSLRRYEHCYWIPAGSYLATADQARLPAAIRVVDGESE
ncbi:MAG: DUF58 domain-containing protein [Planctomycetes bacterium]|nr:DUF58 domain-containing protein [Planctomycetota bacterium]